MVRRTVLVAAASMLAFAQSGADTSEVKVSVTRASESEDHDILTYEILAKADGTTCRDFHVMGYEGTPIGGQAIDPDGNGPWSAASAGGVDGGQNFWDNGNGTGMSVFQVRVPKAKASVSCIVQITDAGDSANPVRPMSLNNIGTVASTGADS